MAAIKGLESAGVRRSSRDLLIAAAFLAGLGTAAGLTAFLTYITRYSRFDGLQGSIDDDLYTQITTAAPSERAAIFGGMVMLLLAVVLLLVHWIASLRADAHPSGK